MYAWPLPKEAQSSLLSQGNLPFPFPYVTGLHKLLTLQTPATLHNFPYHV